MQDRVSKSKRPMVRKQFFITQDQNRRLKAAAAAAGVAEADVVRESIEQTLAQRSRAEPDWRKRMADVLATIQPNEAFANRVEESKKFQAKLWRKRIDRNRKLIDGG
jgi:hypothetical protein